jgi:hypothetical protein
MPSGDRDLTLNSRKSNEGVPPQDEGHACDKRKGVKANAFNSTCGSSHCGGCSPVAGESVHSDAGIHQVNSERRCGNRRGSVAAEYFWTVSFAFARSHWIVRQAIGKSDYTKLIRSKRQMAAARR